MVLLNPLSLQYISLIVELNHFFVHSEVMVSAFCSRYREVEGREGRYTRELGLGPHPRGVQNLEGDD